MDNLTEKHSILLIDDEPGNLELLILYLEDYQFTVYTALNGQDGLQAAQNDQPSLILLDISMPHMDGFAVCAALKADARTEQIPVIFFTASHDVEIKAKGFALGAVDYITKPVRQQELLARVTAHLNQQRLYSSLLKRLNAYQERFGELNEAEELEQELPSHQLKRIYRVRELLIQDLTEPPSLTDLAHSVGINPKKLSRDFQVLYGMPIFEWLREYRLQKARSLLRDSDYPAEQIAQLVGYSNGANFSTAFKQRFQLSPRQYRKLRKAE